MICWHFDSNKLSEQTRTQVTCLIVICVAGTALSQVTIHIDYPTPSPPPTPGEPNLPPTVGRAAVIFALVAACPSFFMSLAVAVVRILQIRLTGITFSNNVIALLFSYLVSCNSEN